MITTVSIFKKTIAENLKNKSITKICADLGISPQHLYDFLKGSQPYKPIIPIIADKVLNKKVEVIVKITYILDNESFDFTCFSDKIKDFLKQIEKDYPNFSLKIFCQRLKIPIYAKILKISKGKFVSIKNQHLQTFFQYFGKNFDFKEEILVKYL